MKLITQFACLPLLLITFHLGAAPPDASNGTKPDWYEISLVIFKNRNAANVSESWRSPDQLDLHFPPNALELETPTETLGSHEVAFRKLDPTDKEFKQALASVKVSPSYEVLTTQTWRQPALPKEEALPVLVQAGNEFDGLYELEGTITVFVSRYLHVVSNLWLADYVQRVEPLTPWWQSDNLLGREETSDQFGAGFPRSSEQVPAETITRYESVRTVKLHESRRMRSNELHYLDHPLFGMLVKVTSYDPETDGGAEADK